MFNRLKNRLIFQLSSFLISSRNRALQLGQRCNSKRTNQQISERTSDGGHWSSLRKMKCSISYSFYMTLLCWSSHRSLLWQMRWFWKIDCRLYGLRKAMILTRELSSSSSSSTSFITCLNCWQYGQIIAIDLNHAKL